MFNYRLTANGRKIAHSRYLWFIGQGCSPSQARNAAEALTLEEENPSYHRTHYDQQAINNCWSHVTQGDKS